MSITAARTLELVYLSLILLLIASIVEIIIESLKRELTNHSFNKMISAKYIIYKLYLSLSIVIT